MNHKDLIKVLENNKIQNKIKYEVKNGVIHVNESCYYRVCADTRKKHHWLGDCTNTEINCYVHFHSDVDFGGSKLTTISSNMKFDGLCNLTDTPITTISPDVLFNGSLYIKNTMLSELPILNIGDSLVVCDKIIIANGTYINCKLFSDIEKYKTMNDVIVNGYCVENGLLS